jgi:hypothetical protein
MKTFDYKPMLVYQTLKTRILNLWNPTASPLGRSITTQPPRGEGRPFIPPAKLRGILVHFYKVGLDLHLCEEVGRFTMVKNIKVN